MIEYKYVMEANGTLWLLLVILMASAGAARADDCALCCAALDLNDCYSQPSDTD
jgi:hypothetical protein